MTFVKSEKSHFPLCRITAALSTAWLVTACGGGSDLACGAGTVQKGDQCVATAAVHQKDSGAGGEAPEASTDGGNPEGSVEGGGSGGAGGAPNDGGGGKPDAAPPDVVVFGGITSASPASSTPPPGHDAGIVTPDAIRVTWNDASYPKDPTVHIHYEVQFSLASGKESSAGAYIAPPGSTSFTVEGLAASKKVFFKVVAVAEGTKAIDKVGPTKELSATPAFDDTPPTFDGASSASPNGPKSVLVKWKAPAKDTQTATAGITYRVYWTPDANGVLQLGAVSDPGASQVTVNGLPAPETPYYFKVVAVDAAGNADTNDIRIQGQTGSDTTAPIFGGCLSASDASATEATVTWAPAFDDTTPANQIVYKVYASDVTIATDTPFSSLQVVGTFTGGTSGRVSGLNAASEYRFICHALDTFANEDDNRVIQTTKTKSDGKPPTFTGVTKAAPNPAVIGIDLTWPQAKDDQSSDGAIVYNIYVSTMQGGEDFTKLPLTTATAGALGKTITKDMLEAVQTAESLTPHASNTQFYFVVRAQDETGNLEKNTVEVSTTTLVSFADDVQPIFTNSCAILVCHTVGVDGQNSPIQGQDLDKGAAYSNIVNVTAREGATIGEPNIKRIDSTNHDKHASYLWRKITATPPFTGVQMPASGSITAQDILTIQSWIEQGALDN